MSTATVSEVKVNFFKNLKFKIIRFFNTLKCDIINYLRWKILRLLFNPKKSNLVKHAEREFEIAGWKKKNVDISQKWVMNNLRDLLAVFSQQGHSGTSAPYVINLFNRLARFQIISSLTGKKNEWNKCSDGVYQNKRDSRVFKEKRGKAYFISGKAFSDDGGKTFWTGKKSRVPVKFPCKASDLKTKYIILKKGQKL